MKLQRKPLISLLLLSLAASIPVSAWAADPRGEPRVVLSELRYDDYPTAALSPDGKTVFISVDGTIWRWDEGAAPKSLVKTPFAAALPLSVQPGSGVLAFGVGGKVGLLDGTSEDPELKEVVDGTIETLRWFPDGKRLWVDAYELVGRTLSVYDAMGEPKRLCVEGRDSEFVFAELAPDGNHVLVGRDELSWTDLSCSGGRTLTRWKGAPRKVHFAPAGGHMAVQVDGGAGVGTQVWLGTPDGKPWRLAKQGAMATNALWLTQDLVVFTDLGAYGADSTGPFPLAWYSIKTRKTRRVALPEGCGASVLAAGSGRAVIAMGCGDQKPTIALLVWPTP